MCDITKMQSSKKDDENFVTLQTELEALKMELTSLKGGGGGGNSEKGSGGGCNCKSIPKWVYDAPKYGEKKEKVVSGKTYYYCKGHGAHKPRWVVHKPSECHGLKDKDDSDDKAKDSKDKPKKKVGWAMMALMVTIDESDSDQE